MGTFGLMFGHNLQTMNKHPYLLLAAILAGGSLFGADKKSKEKPQIDNVTVAFQEPDKFTDARSDFGSMTDERLLDVLSDHLKKTATKKLAAGQKLEVTIKDVDLAGDFIPGRPSINEVRIIKEIYIPRISLSFKLTDASGAVIKEGDRRLSDMNFMQNLSIMGRNEPLFYDKQLITDWVSKEFKS